MSASSAEGGAPDAVAGRLTALRAQGAEGFDGPGLRFIEGLLTRAQALAGPARVRLEARALARLDALSDRFHAARAAAQATLIALQAAGADGDGQFAAGFAAGRFTDLERRAPGALRRAQAQDPEADRARLVRLAREARKRGLPLGDAGALVEAAEAGAEPPAAAPADARAVGDALARQLFKAAADQARSAVVVARAADTVPSHHGPYNPEALVAEALARLDALSAPYLRAWLVGLEDLAGLQALPEARPPGKRRGR
ncbi:MAG: DUF2894 domain-containing protein [Myxococcales bacterium]|nr:DUF2894 domain-containing protein [Myxococcales bacterium]